MPSTTGCVAVLLDRLEEQYGSQQPSWPTDPYEFIIWWHCGYPQSDDRCAKGWTLLTREIGTAPRQILQAKPKAIAAALKSSVMLPELGAQRLKEIAARVQDEFGGDLRGALIGPPAQARKVLKKFHSIADPGADRILLFAGISPVAAVPSNCPHVLVRLLHGLEREDYGTTYREAQRAISDQVPETFDARLRSYLLLKQHGQRICKRTNPKCDQCPVSKECAYFAGRNRGRAHPQAVLVRVGCKGRRSGS
jgi:endonuclease-3